MEDVLFEISKDRFVLWRGNQSPMQPLQPDIWVCWLPDTKQLISEKFYECALNDGWGARIQFRAKAKVGHGFQDYKRDDFKTLSSYQDHDKYVL